jgi:hypothetical protein
MQKRKTTKEVAAIARKAKKAMASWMSVLGYVPSGQEVRAWQAGYVAGVNSQNDD